MRSSIRTYIDSIIKDNARYMLESGCSTIAEWFHLNNCDTSDYYLYFDEDEIVGDEVTQKQMNEADEYIDRHYDIEITEENLKI
jgi:hypothetical protein